MVTMVSCRPRFAGASLLCMQSRYESRPLLPSRVSGPAPKPAQRSSTVTTCSYRDGRSRGPRQQRRAPYTVNITEKSLAEYGLPAMGLLVVGALVAGPILSGLVFAAASLGMAVVAASTLGWVFLPLLALGGAGVLLGGAMFAGVFAVSAGGLLVWNLIKLGALGAALWLGAKFAQTVFGIGSPSEGSGTPGRGWREPEAGPNGTIDVEASTVDDWKDEVLREQRRREEELREFDDLLRRREAFKKGTDGLGR